MRYIRSTLVLPIALAGLLTPVLAPQALAQESTQPSTQQQQGQMSQQQNFSKEKLQSFAAASEEIQKIDTKYGTRMQNAKSQKEAMELRKEGQSKMLNAVQDNGLSVEEYSTIAQAVQENPELLQRIMQMRDN